MGDLRDQGAEEQRRSQEEEDTVYLSDIRREIKLVDQQAKKIEIPIYDFN